MTEQPYLPQPMTEQRVAVAKAMYQAEQPMTAADLTRVTGLTWPTCNGAAVVFEKAGWFELISGGSHSIRFYCMTHEGEVFTKALLRERP
jgi:hypothetical protein